MKTSEEIWERLSIREQKIVGERFGVGGFAKRETKVIANEFGVDETRIYQIEKMAFKHMAEAVFEDIKTQADWLPSEGEYYYVINDEGGVFRLKCGPKGLVAKKARDFMGIYKTKAEAEKARDAIRKFTKNHFRF